jgi:predicted HTH transcriptional regulator
MTADLDSLQEDTKNMLDNPETIDVEYKESFNGMNADDLVAFANAKGGTILIGVKDTTDESGKQRGTVLGCDKTFDDGRLIAMDKAANCSPPIKVVVTRERNEKGSIFRIDIKEAQVKPCCTRSGRYTIRESGRKRGITPIEMSALILEREASVFISRLQNAGQEFVTILKKGQDEIAENITALKQITKSTREISITAVGVAAAAKKTVDEIMRDRQIERLGVYDGMRMKRKE